MRVTSIAAVVLAAALTTAAAGEHQEISSRRAAERKAFTDAEISEGFFRTAFGAELHIAGAVNRIRKFEVPVRVHVDPDDPQRVLVRGRRPYAGNDPQPSWGTPVETVDGRR